MFVNVRVKTCKLMHLVRIHSQPHNERYIHGPWMIDIEWKEGGGISKKHTWCCALYNISFDPK